MFSFAPVARLIDAISYTEFAAGEFFIAILANATIVVVNSIRASYGGAMSADIHP